MSAQLGLVFSLEEHAHGDHLAMAFHGTTPGAEVSDDGLYRYLYWWPIGVGPTLVVCMVNPSVAGSAKATDATVRWLLGYARHWGYGRVVIVNLAALISTDPAALYAHPDPIGPRNLQTLRQVCAGHEVLCAWGNAAQRIRGADRSARVVRDAARLTRALGVTKSGEPRHPLRVAHATPLRYWP